MPEREYITPIGKGRIVQLRNDVTIAANRVYGKVGLRHSGGLRKEGISCEIIGPRTLAPLEEGLILVPVENNQAVFGPSGG